MTSFIMKSNADLDVESKALVEPSSKRKAAVVDNDNSHAESKKNRGSSLKQVVAAMIANMGTINTGLVFGFSATALPQMQTICSSVVLDSDEASWFASLSSITTPIGCILSGWLMDFLGRKRTLIVTELPLIIGWIMIAFAKDIPLLYTGRLLIGLGSGMVGAPARVYTSEVTQPHLRGMLLALASVGVSLGVLIQYTLGSFVSWSILAGLSAINPIASLILILLMPETPNWLLSRGRIEDAREALHHCRGNTYDVDKELEDMVSFAAKNKIVRPTGFKQTISAVFTKATMKPFAILVIYFFAYQWSGVNSVTFYAVNVFEDSGTSIDKNLATVLLGVVRFISTIAACIALRRCGRRPLTMISGLGCGIFMISMGSYMYALQQWKASGVEPLYTWIPLICIFGFIISCTMGFLVVPWVMIGEVYPRQVRGIAGGFTTCMAHFFVFTVVKTYPYLLQHLNSYGTFILYGCISLVGSIFFYICLPETKGRTLEEIEDYFSGRVKKLGTRNLPEVLDVQKGDVLP